VQRDLRDSRAKLDSIQAERSGCSGRWRQLRTRVRDASRELLNIERQRETSRSALLELEFQTELLTRTSKRHARSTRRRRQRLRAADAGPEPAAALHLQARPHAFGAGAAHVATFGDLLNRYKYLHLMAMYDRMVVQDVARLERELARRSRSCASRCERLELLREEKAGEVAQLERVERQRQATLRQFRQQETRTAGRITSWSGSSSS
jgi:murein hydrolase activator